MKSLIVAFSICAMGFAQVPSGYYDTANGLTGLTLKSELARIISANYNAQSYNALRNLYAISDNDEYYDNGQQTGTILDIYSENPAGSDPYNFSTTNNNDRCGNYSGEGDCWNREHIFPQGFFNQREPMRSDAHHVVPTDGFVNGGRSNLPFGLVSDSGSGRRVYANGSKKGASDTPGYSGQVFEPIDEFKGDVARMLFYFATRYENNFNDNSWDSPNAANDPRDGSKGAFYEQWYVDLLLDWHNQDPVSQREIDRNNDVYNFQNNANPYIDNPQFVDMIWTSSTAPSGSLMVTMTASYNDLDNNGFDQGDEITYDYTLENTGSSTLFNVTINQDRGSFSGTTNVISSIAANQTLNNPYGSLTVILGTQDIAPANTLCLVSNQLTVTADYNASGSGMGLTILSDDPNDSSNVDSNNDNIPDDPTNVVVCGSTVGSPNDLFISEYIEGSGTNKAIEIANFTGRTISLSDYTVQRDANGGGSWSGSISLTGSIDDNEVHVIARGNADTGILSETDQLIGSGSALDFNGNDPVGLFKNGVLIDIVGVFGNGNSDFAKDVVLVRKPDAVVPNLDFNLTRDWNSLGQSDYSDLGSHTIATLSSANSELERFNIFPNPSSDGVFYLKNMSKNASVYLFDMSGRSIDCEIQNQAIHIYKTGIYILRINYGNASTSKKLIVQ
ncbi:MAG: endonuclease [Nonlabens sp.]